MREVFLSSQDDARGLCLAWLLSDDREEDLSVLRRSSEMGNAFACSTLCLDLWGESKEEAFRLAQFAAPHHERDGFYMLGVCFRNGVGCEKDLNLAKENLLIAAELGSVYAVGDYAQLLSEFDPSRWLLLGRSALRGYPG